MSWWESRFRPCQNRHAGLELQGLQFGFFDTHEAVDSAERARAKQDLLLFEQSLAADHDKRLRERRGRGILAGAISKHDRERDFKGSPLLVVRNFIAPLKTLDQVERDEAVKHGQIDRRECGYHLSARFRSD